MSSLLAVIVPLFVAMTPLTVVPLFVSMVEGKSREEARDLARKAVMTALGLAILIILGGQAVFRFLSITVDDLRVGGGLILLVLSVHDLVFSTESRKQKEIGSDAGIVPIGTPLLVGPATMTACVTLADIHGKFIVLAGLLINLALTGVLLYYQDVFTKVVHPGISKAFGKVMSLFLAAISVSMIRAGIEAMLTG
ncbi:MAG: MarC family protein [Myxococcota bacterium]